MLRITTNRKPSLACTLLRNGFVGGEGRFFFWLIVRIVFLWSRREQFLLFTEIFSFAKCFSFARKFYRETWSASLVKEFRILWSMMFYLFPELGLFEMVLPKKRLPSFCSTKLFSKLSHFPYGNSYWCYRIDFTGQLPFADVLFADVLNEEEFVLFYKSFTILLWQSLITST